MCTKRKIFSWIIPQNLLNILDNREQGKFYSLSNKFNVFFWSNNISNRVKLRDYLVFKFIFSDLSLKERNNSYTIN